MERIPDHPVIQNMERTGYPDGKEPSIPRCPCCGEECEMIIKDRMHAIVGCENCTSVEDPWELDECFPKEEDDYE